MKSTKILLLSVFAMTLHGQQTGTIQVGRPKLWPFAEARSLIFDSRKALSTLQIKKDKELDPNAINLRQLDSLRTALSISAEFDQYGFLKGRSDLRDYAANRELQVDKKTRADQLTAEIRVLNARKAAASAQKARMEGKNEINVKRLAEIDALLSANSETNPALTAEERQRLSTENISR
ncbi:MAG TPA: hypothetical protein VEX68_13620 [Bryobacteraceae bacterium]|nr:hypothetical protein [Bryobacteraceae bacterium]